METSAADKDVEAQKSNSFSAVEKLPELSVRERDAVDNQSRPNAALIHETIRAEGESELDRTVSALLLSGLAAGLSMGLSLLVQGLLQARLPEAPWRELVSYLGYTVGFLARIIREAGIEDRWLGGGARFGCVTARVQRRSRRSAKWCGLRVLGLRWKGSGGACAPAFN
jgi:hypothetical protein